MLPPGEVGEIRIKGPNVTRGYWNRPQETAEAFVGDRFLTGDIGYMDADGYFFLVDRKKDMIISGGFNVYPQMIEQAIYEHPAVQEVIVIGIPDGYRGEAAKAFVKLRTGAAPFTLDELKAFLAGKLGRHEIPAALDFVDELPRTSVGKLSRHELRKLQPAPDAAARQPQLAREAGRERRNCHRVTAGAPLTREVGSRSDPGEGLRLSMDVTARCNPLPGRGDDTLSRFPI